MASYAYTLLRYEEKQAHWVASSESDVARFDSLEIALAKLGGAGFRVAHVLGNSIPKLVFILEREGR